MDPFDLFGRPHPAPGDDAPEWTRPEVIAAEQRVLTMADALVSFMKRVAIESDEAGVAIDKFMAHITDRNPALSRTDVFILDKMDPDTNRLFLDLLRAAWERRCWRFYYGEIPSPHHPDR